MIMMAFVIVMVRVHTVQQVLVWLPLLIHHGSTDAPTVDVVETGVGAGTIVDNASYKD